MKKWNYFIAALCTAILISVGAVAFYVVSFVIRYGYAASAEYPTVAVILEVTQFVEENGGNWPTSWQELGTSEEIRGHALIRFDVTSEQILAEPGLIHEAIQPVTGHWRVHPDGEYALEHLLERIEFMKNQYVKEQ